MNRAGWIIGALLLPAMPALAQTGADPAPARPPEAKKICRTLTPTGQRLSQKVCLTQAQWDEVDAANDVAARGLISQLMRQSGTPAASPNPMTGR